MELRQFMEIRQRWGSWRLGGHEVLGTEAGMEFSSWILGMHAVQGTEAGSEFMELRQALSSWN